MTVATEDLKCHKQEHYIFCEQDDIMVELTRTKWWWVGHILRTTMSNITSEALLWTPDGKSMRGSWTAARELVSVHLFWSGARGAAQLARIKAVRRNYVL